MLVVGPIAFAPVAALSWDLDAAALPYVAGSAALQLTYFVLLTAAYGRSELSLSTRSRVALPPFSCARQAS